MSLFRRKGNFSSMKRSDRTGALNFNGVNNDENNFLITRLDPFHDRPYVPMGGPGSAPTVVRTFRRSVTVSNPNPTSTGMWSFAVGSGVNGYPYIPAADGIPVMQIRNMQPGLTQTTGAIDINYTYGANNAYATYSAASTQGARGTHHPICPIYVVGVDAPTIQFSTQVTDATGNPVLPSTARDRAIGVCQFGENVYADGPSKLISMAYEVHMTTSDLYNTGILTVGRVPQALTTTSMRIGAIGTDPVTNVAVATSAVLPTNTADLLLFSGSRQWPAKYGVYAVIPEASSTCPDFDPNPFQFHLRRSQSWQSGLSNPSGTTAIAIVTANRSSVTTIASTEHFDSVLTFLEGLDPRATFSVTVILTYETIPTDDQLLRPLARLPMEIRPHVIEALSQLSSRIEPYCMVAENASGGFFRRMSKAYDAAKKVVNSPAGKAIVKIATPMIKSALPPTALQAIEYAGQAQRAINTAKKKKGKKKQNGQSSASASQNGMVVNPFPVNSRRR